MIDQTKRNTLKAMTAAGAGVAVATVTPTVLAAARSVVLPHKTPSHVPFSGITITHFENPHGRTILLSNETDRTITLQDVTPGYVETAKGEFSLAPLFQEGALSIPANGTQAVSLSHNGEADRYASWVHTGSAPRIAQAELNKQFVSVVSRYEALENPSALQLYTADLVVS